MELPQTFPASASVNEVVCALLSLTGATTAVAAPVARELAQYLLSDREAGDSFTIANGEWDADARSTIGMSAAFAVINNRTQTGAHCWAYRGAFEWEF